MATPRPPKHPLVVVLGATGTGKSKLAVQLAQHYPAEILNGDAMQLYAGLRVITNKLSAAEQSGIPHHLLGVVGVEDEPWTVGDFGRVARGNINEVHARGKLPILVGGTHYYLQSLLFRNTLAVSSDPPTILSPTSDSKLHKKSEAAHDEVSPDTAQAPDGISLTSPSTWPVLDMPTSTLLDELRRVDPAMAERWHPNDRRKIRRSLEIYLQTGQRASDVYAAQRLQSHPLSLSSARHITNCLAHELEEGEDRGEEDFDPTQGLIYPTLFLWTHTPRPILTSRLDARVLSMLEAGLLSEVRELDHIRSQLDLRDAGIDYTKGIWASIGYKEFRAYNIALARAEGQARVESETDLDKETRAEENGNGKELEASKTQAIEATQAATRQYARTQLRWIKAKLLPALCRANSAQFLHVLDTSSTSPEVWEANVLVPAKELVARFLARGKDALPDPLAASDMAREVLMPKSHGEGEEGDEERLKKQICEMCDVTTIGEEQWQTHLRSKRHRGVLKRRRRMEAKKDGVEQDLAEGDGIEPP